MTEGKATDEAKGTLVVTIQGSYMLSAQAFINVDGTLTASYAGSKSFRLPAGKHHVRVHSEWMRSFGSAGMQVEVRPNATTNVYYAPPWSQWTSEGNIGVTKQKRPDTLVFFGSMTALFLVFLFIAMMAIS